MRACPLLSLLLLAGMCCAADGAKQDPNAGIISDPAATEVWTTEQGTKYHTKDCVSAKVKTNLAAAVIDGDTPCGKCSPPVYDPAKVVVFLGGDAGKKYHLFSCKFAKNASTLTKAVADGLAPCGVCKPPTVWAPPKADQPAAPAK